MVDTATRDKVRLWIGDTNADRLLFNDNEIDLVIDGRAGHVLLSAADACDILATRFARDHDFEWQGGTNQRGKFSRSQMSKAYAAQAASLRERANSASGVDTFATTRVDGLSDDLDSREGSRSRRQDGEPEVPIEFLDQDAIW